jgi:phosphonate transport system substrate-binding protein
MSRPTTILRVFLLVFTVTLPTFNLSANETAESGRPLIFGTIPIAKPTRLLEMYQPLVRYLEERLGREIQLEVGRDYPDAIEKFQSGYFDLGYLGPSPYIIATESSPLGNDNFRLVATIETNNKPYYHATIVVRKDNSDIKRVDDLHGKRFAFGSRLSTLSCYLPAAMLIDSGVFDTLESYRFLGKHDAVVNAVYLNHFEAGGIKESVANDSTGKVRILAESESVWDFMILTHRDFPEALFEQLRQAVIELREPQILGAIKPGVTGFVETSDSKYENLRQIMRRVDARLGPPLGE